MTCLIAAHDASEGDKARADFVCDGVDDQVELQRCCGKIELTAGHFNLSEPLDDRP